MVWIGVVSLLALAAEPAAGPRGAALRASCSAAAEVVARLAPGTPLAVRSSFSGDDGACFKVEAAGGSGWVFASETVGVEEYQRGLRSAGEVVVKPPAAEEQPKEAPAGGTEKPANASIAAVLNLINANEPRRALQALEGGLLAEHASDPFVLQLAGLAALRDDQPRSAVQYFEKSLALKPSAQVEQFLARARRELSADRSRERVHGNRFLLRYDTAAIPEVQANLVMGSLEQAYAAISSQLGCTGAERIVAVIQDGAAFRGATGAPEWSNGQFDGRIRVPLEGGKLTPQMQRTLTHEVVHACLVQLGHWPAWLHEGLAQRFSGERLGGMPEAQVRDRLRYGQMPRLNGLSQTWSRMGPDRAAAAYAAALLAVNEIYTLYGPDGMRSLLHNPTQLQRITAELDDRLAGR